MKTKVLLFGILADEAKRSMIEIENVTDTNVLLTEMKKINSVFSNSKYVVAVNKKIVSANQTLLENDEVALLPPFAGG